MTWVEVADGVEATHDGYWTYVMTCVNGNRWDVSRVRGSVSSVIASHQTPDDCRQAVLDSARPRMERL